MERASKLMKLSTLLCMVVLCKAIESPQYAVVHEESDFEVRLYSQSTWMSARVREELSFAKATLLGFHRLFQYIQGANLNYSRIAMTSPIVTSLVPGAGPLHSYAYVVSLYLPDKFQSDPPTPLPEIHLNPFEWDSHCVAVRKFSGFAIDEVIVKEADNLSFSLRRSPWANSTSSDSGYAYSVAQYSPPLQFIGRVNEIWVDIDVSGINSCKPGAVARCHLPTACSSTFPLLLHFASNLKLDDARSNGFGRALAKVSTFSSKFTPLDGRLERQKEDGVIDFSHDVSHIKVWNNKYAIILAAQTHPTKLIITTRNTCNEYNTFFIKKLSDRKE